MGVRHGHTRFPLPLPRDFANEAHLAAITTIQLSIWTLSWLHSSVVLFSSASTFFLLFPPVKHLVRYSVETLVAGFFVSHIFNVISACGLLPARPWISVFLCLDLLRCLAAPEPASVSRSFFTLKFLTPRRLFLTPHQLFQNTKSATKVAGWSWSIFFFF